MADAYFKATTFYRTNRRAGGWSESWYVLAANHEAAMTVCQSINTARLELAPPSTIADACRVALPGNPRDSRVRVALTALGQWATVAADGIPDAYDALSMSQVIDDYRPIHRYFHNFPQSFFDEVVGLWDAAGDELTAWTAFIDTMFAESGGIKPWCRVKVGETYEYRRVLGLRPLALVRRKVGRPFALQVGHQ